MPKAGVVRMEQQINFVHRCIESALRTCRRTATHNAEWVVRSRSSVCSDHHPC